MSPCLTCGADAALPPNPRCCECEIRVFPPRPEIAAGLASLPRQLGGFPEYRAAMLGMLRRRTATGSLRWPALEEWRAREGDDHGLMILEWWAYLFDVLGFYNQQLAQNAYLRTATDEGALRRLTALIGYRPRPAVAAEALLAALVDAGPERQVPESTAFRSEAFGAEPPQVYETDADRTVAWPRNRWTLAPVPGSSGTVLLFDPRTLRLTPGSMALFRWSSTQWNWVKVLDVRTVRAVDGQSYARVSVDQDPGFGANAVSVEMFTQVAAFNRVSDAVISGNDLLLDSEYPRIGRNERVMLAPSGASPIMVTASDVDTAKAVPRSSLTAVYPERTVTRLRLDTAPATTWQPDGSVVHYGLVTAGTVVHPAKVRIQRADLQPNAAIAGIAEPLDTPAPGPLLLEDRDQRGVRIDGTVAVQGDGAGMLLPANSSASFAEPLVPPITVYGNVVHVVRGETVNHEVLGSGVAGVAFPTFKLKKKPLTYVSRSGAPNGRGSTLEIRVNGLLWREVDSFFGTTAEDAVYIVRQNEDHDSFVTFWRLPAGVDNVVARYRFGAGAAKPPAGTMTQAVRPVKGVRVVNPVMPWGGADADRPRDIRRNAPSVALTLGRAISLADFEAMARSFGAVNVAAGWAWDHALQRAVAKLFCIASGSDISASLRGFLAGQSDPSVMIVVAPASPVTARLIVDFTADERAERATVLAALVAALSDDEHGLLAHANVPIGGSIFRSVLEREVLAVPGVASINGITVNGTTMPVALSAAEGCFHDFLPFTNAA